MTMNSPHPFITWLAPKSVSSITATLSFNDTTIVDAASETADEIRNDRQSGNDAVLDRMHVFSPSLAAKQYCKCKGALILGYLANRIHALKNEREGHYWFYTTIEALSEQYPYLPPSTIADTLRSLCEADSGCLLRKRFNRRSGDKTWWYAFANDDHFQEALKPVKPIHFSVRDAVDRGDVVEAVIMANLRKHFQDKAEGSAVRMSANALSKIIPFSKAQILSALECLINDDVVAKVARGGRDRAFSVIKGKHWPGERDNPPGSFSDMAGDKSEMAGLVSEMAGRKSDDVTCCNLNCNHLLKEESFTLGSASPSLASDSCKSLTDLSANKQLVASCQSNQAEDCDSSSMALLSSGSYDLASRRVWDLGVTSFIDLELLNECNSSLLANETTQRLALEAGTTFLQSLSVPDLFLIHSIEFEQRVMDYLLPRFERDHFELLQRRLQSASADSCNTLAVLVLQAALEWTVKGFMGYRDHRYLTGKHGYKMEVEICRLLWPLKEELQRQEIERQLNERKANFRSPDHQKEGAPQLSPYEKAGVFNNSLIERQAVGWFTRSGTLKTDVIHFHGGCLKYANQLFTQNPDLTVHHLNRVLDSCVDTGINVPPRESPDPLFFTRKGTSIFSFLKNLDKILAELQMNGELPIVQFLDPMQFVEDDSPSMDTGAR
jgi:hypothetical protein